MAEGTLHRAVAKVDPLLGAGERRLGGEGSGQRFKVEGGFLQVVDDTVRVVTEKATAV